MPTKKNERRRPPRGRPKAHAQTKLKGIVDLHDLNYEDIARVMTRTFKQKRQADSVGRLVRGIYPVSLDTARLFAKVINKLTGRRYTVDDLF